MTSEAYLAGAFCWNDVTTTDPAAAKTFYTDLFGWSCEDVNAGGDMPYTLFRLDGADVMGLAEMPPHLRQMGMPSFWSAYVAVDSCDKTAATVPELGGTVVVEPFDIPGAGRTAVICDPQGAVVRLWQADRTQACGQGRAPAQRGICWNELATTDTEAAADFYGELFQWNCKDCSGEWGSYFEFLAPSGTVAGMLPIRPEWGDVPPHWLSYAAVADCDAATARVRELGGGVIRTPMEVPEVGRFAVVHDAQGAVFAVIKLF